MTTAQSAPQITEDTLIGDVVEQHPELIETLLNYGVHCVGCHASPYEPIGEGLRAHGLSDEEVEDAVMSLNRALKEHQKMKEKEVSKTVKAAITLSDLAATKVKEACVAAKKKALRIGIVPGGCSGFQYLFSLTDTAEKNDLVVEKNNAVVYLDTYSAEKLDGAQIDYHDALTGAGFKIKNPNATGGCGCGSSFK